MTDLASDFIRDAEEATGNVHTAEDEAVPPETRTKETPCPSS